MALAENSTLEMLSMSGNYVGGLGASALANGMISNEGIKGLMLNGNDIGNIGQSKFAWFHSVLQAVFFFSKNMPCSKPS